MKKKSFINSTIVEGVLFLLLGGWLMYYGFDSRSKAFNKDWSQSPYLFPVIVAGMMAALAVSLLAQGIQAARAGASGAEKAEGKARPDAVRVLVVLGMSILYYVALSAIRLPYLGTVVGGMHLAVSTFELATVVFLFALLFYMGVRSKPVLIALPICTTVVLSILFRSMLHVLLP